MKHADSDRSPGGQIPADQQASGEDTSKIALAVALTLALGTSYASTPNYGQDRIAVSSPKAVLGSILTEASSRHSSAGTSSEISQQLALNYGKNFENYAKNFENYAKNFENYAKNFENYAKNFENYGRNFENPDILKRSREQSSTSPVSAGGTLPNGAALPLSVHALLEKIHARDTV